VERTLGALGVLAGVVLLGGDVVHADAAGPTDYRSEVVAVVPETPAVAVSIVGGDAFVELEVAPGTEVLVVGYQNEPFLHIRPDGVVEENERSPSVYVSRTRMGGADVPDYADAALPPAWKAVATGGRYAWHDHRAHWMSPDAPTTAVPGDKVQTGVIPLIVAGVAVSVTVDTYWLPAPSRVPLYAGAVGGVMLVVGALVGRRALAWPLLVAALAAAGVGWWQFSSLPAETDPRLVWWLLPAVAAASASAAVVLGRRLVAYALVILGGLELAAWVFVRRAGAWRALIPTDAPLVLDRAVLVGVAVVALAAMAGGIIALYRITD